MDRALLGIVVHPLRSEPLSALSIRGRAPS